MVGLCRSDVHQLVQELEATPREVLEVVGHLKRYVPLSQSRRVAAQQRVTLHSRAHGSRVEAAHDVVRRLHKEVRADEVDSDATLGCTAVRCNRRDRHGWMVLIHSLAGTELLAVGGDLQVNLTGGMSWRCAFVRPSIGESSRHVVAGAAETAHGHLRGNEIVAGDNHSRAATRRTQNGVDTAEALAIPPLAIADGDGHLHIVGECQSSRQCHVIANELH